MANGSNPYSLFPILILLAFGLDPNMGQKMDTFKTAVDKISAGVNNLRATVKSLSTDFNDVNLMLLNLNKPTSVKTLDENKE